MSQGSSPQTVPNATPSQKPTNFRWVICGLLFAATTINYLDRSVINVVGPDIKKSMGWSATDYGLISAAFVLAYAIGFIFVGRIIDALGTRITYAGSLIFWSLAAAAHALAGTAMQFGVARFFLGLGESGNFPAAVKTVAEWFPQRQRATATGIFNAGSNVGAILAPLVLPFVVIRWGWQASFLITGFVGIIWVFFWIPLYRSPDTHPLCNQAERDLIHDLPPGTRAAALPLPGAPKEASIKWRQLLAHRQAWAFMAGKFFTDPVWWFFFTWSGIFFSEKFGVDITTIGPPLIIIYVLADFGSILGGWMSSTLIRRGMTANKARKLTMLTCAFCVLPVIFAPMIPNDWVIAGGRFDGLKYGMLLSATLIGIAAAAHQGFSANIFTVTSDMFPKSAIGSVVGLGGFAGSIATIFMQTGSGIVRDATGNYVILFVIAGFIYFFAVGAVHLLAPRMDKVDEAELRSSQTPLFVWVAVWGVVGLLAGLPLSYQFQDHSLPNTKTFGVYLDSVRTGVIFRVKPPAPPATTPAATTTVATIPATTPLVAEATRPAIVPAAPARSLTAEELTANRAKILPALLGTPIAAAALMALLGALVHGVLFRKKSNGTNA